MIDYKSKATPRTVTPDGTAVYCSYDEIVNIQDLKPNPANPNEHGAKQISLLGNIIVAAGWRAPITVSKRSGYIVKGHGRRLAAIAKKLAFAPVEYQEYASEAEEHADLMADNRIAELADMNDEKLVDMLQKMADENLPAALAGFSDKELVSMLDKLSADAPTNDDQADAVNNSPAGKPMSQINDLWLLGSHRLICGSATDADTIDRLMDGHKAQLVHTDPPYGVSYETQSGKFGMIKNDDKTGDDLMGKLLIPAFQNYVKHTTDDAAFYIWHASSTRRDFEDAMTAVGLLEKQYLIWVKTAPVLGHADYQWAHEPCFYAEKVGKQAKFYGDRSQRTTWKATVRDAESVSVSLTGGVVLLDGNGHKMYVNDKAPKGKKVRSIRMQKARPVYMYPESDQTTVWEIARETNTVHPTQKPVEIPIRAITNSSKPGDIVLDFFGGSGSTLIAAEMTGRICYTTELDPKYCDAIVKRYIETSGNDNVTCIRDGKEIPYQTLQQ